MKKIVIAVISCLALSVSAAQACEFCTVHNGLGQYNNQGDFVSLAYRSTYASTTVDGGSSVQSGHDHNLSINTVQAYYQHSFSENLKGQLVVPYLQKKQNHDGESDSSSGLGDVIAMLRYTVWGDHDQFLAVMGGLKLPTGTKKNENGTNTFSPDLALGTGSTDPLIGLVYNHNIGLWNYSLDALYKFSGKGYDGYQFGNVLNLGLNGYYTLNNNFNIGAGFLSETTAADNDSDGTVTGAAGTVDSTGGTVIFAQPAIQYTRENFYAELAYQLPVYRNFIGTQLVVDNKLVLSVRYAF
ncbi:MAG: hypothetical protein HZA04_04565 [Nitrospinae bacterium]|nr:hypothetical protein [Nitrospinota bacterium]